METLVLQLLSTAGPSGVKLSEAGLEERAAAVFKAAAGAGTLDRVRLYNLLADWHVRGHTVSYTAHTRHAQLEVGWR